MDHPLSLIDVMEQQLDLWLRLAAAIEEAQGALLRGDVQAFEQSTEDQAECCRRYRVLCPGGASISPSDPPSPTSPALLGEIEQARRRVRHLNQVHAALLRRASRSLRILRNLMSPAGAPYDPPARLQSPSLSPGRG